MMAEWIGPYKVLRKVNEYNYEIQLLKRKTIQHINMLKKYQWTVGAVLVVDYHSSINRTGKEEFAEPC